MQGLVGAEFAADCEEILPRAREALNRWRQQQQQQQQQQQEQQQQQKEPGEAETKGGAHEGEEQFYAQVLYEMLALGFRV